MRIRRLAALLGLAVAMTLAAGQHAQAAFDVSILSTIVSPAGGTVVGSGGNSAVTISSPITNPVVQSAAPPSGTDFVMANIQATDLGVAATYMDAYTIGYRFDITVTDLASTASHTFVVTGTVSGTVNGTGTSYQSSLGNAYDPGVAPQTVLIGTTLYTFSLPAGITYAAPGGPNGAGLPGNPGAFSGHLVAAVPEPASMVLVGLGGLMTVGLYRRRRSAS